MKRFRISRNRNLLAESLHVRGIPAVIVWALTFPIFSLVALIGGQVQGVLSSSWQLFVATVVGVGLGINYWYFPRIEAFIRAAADPDTELVESISRHGSRLARFLARFAKRSQLSLAMGDDNPRIARHLWTTTVTTALRVPSPSLKADVVAVLFSTCSIIGVQTFDFAAGTCCRYLGYPVTLPWGYVLQFLEFVGYWYFTTVGLSLLFHYTLRWRLLAQWIKKARLEDNPSGIDREDWGRW